MGGGTYYLIFSFPRSDNKAERDDGFVPINLVIKHAMLFENSAENEERGVLTLGSLCLPC